MARRRGAGIARTVIRRKKRGAISRKRILEPRPFLGPALDAVIANGLAGRVKAAIMSGLKFQRGKNR